MAESLAQKVCTPCRGGTPALTQAEATDYLSQTPGWELQDDGRWLRRTFKFADFRESQGFVDKVGRLVVGHDADLASLTLIVPRQPSDGCRFPCAEKATEHDKANQ